MQKPLEIPAAAAKEPVLVLLLLLLRVNALRNTKDWKSSREESHARLPRIPKIPVSPHPMPDEVAPALLTLAHWSTYTSVSTVHAKSEPVFFSA